jgi:hypothetical protein
MIQSPSVSEHDNHEQKVCTKQHYNHSPQAKLFSVGLELHRVDRSPRVRCEQINQTDLQT